MAITRLWRGWTKPDHADGYERFLLDELFPSMREIAGFIDADVLRRPDGAEVALIRRGARVCPPAAKRSEYFAA